MDKMMLEAVALVLAMMVEDISMLQKVTMVRGLRKE